MSTNPASGVARRQRAAAAAKLGSDMSRMTVRYDPGYEWRTTLPQVGTAQDGLRAQKTVTSTRVVQERVPHEALRGQKTPPPGKRPAAPAESPGPQGLSCRARGVASCSCLLVAGSRRLCAADGGTADVVDSSSLRFLAASALEARRKEEKDLELTRSIAGEGARCSLCRKCSPDALSRSAGCDEIMRQSLWPLATPRRVEEGRRRRRGGRKSLPRCTRPRQGCRRLCDHQRQDPTVSQTLGIPVVTQRQVPTVHSFMLPVQFLDTVLDMSCCGTSTGAWFDGAEYCGSPTVAVHRRSSSFLRSAEADPHGPDCSADHRDSSDAVRF